MKPGDNYMFRYKGYRGSLEWSEEGKHWWGRILDLEEDIKYKGTYTNQYEIDISDVKAQFELVVEKYINKLNKI